MNGVYVELDAPAPALTFVTPAELRDAYALPSAFRSFVSVLEDSSMQLQTIVHTIPPLYDSESRVLLLGSIPSPKSREVGFFYGHPQNRFWPCWRLCLARRCRSPSRTSARCRLRHHVALWDTIAKCDIAGASDTSIRNAEPNDIGKLLRESKITRIFATGGKSAQLYRKLIEPKTGVPITQLPSTSPANAAWSLERLIEAYRVIL